MIDTDERALVAVRDLATTMDASVREDAEALYDYLRRRLAQPDQSEPVAWARKESVDALLRCRNDDVNGCVDVWMRADTDHTVALYTHPDRTQAPGDWVLVPREITREMWKAWEISFLASESYQEDYAAMLAAAPTPPSVP